MREYYISIYPVIIGVFYRTLNKQNPILFAVKNPVNAHIFPNVVSILFYSSKEHFFFLALFIGLFHLFVLLLLCINSPDIDSGIGAQTELNGSSSPFSQVY